MNVSQERNGRKKLVLKRRITRGKKSFLWSNFTLYEKAQTWHLLCVLVYTGRRGELKEDKKRRQRPPPPSGANTTTGPHLPQEFHGSQRGLSQFERGKIASLCKTKKSFARLHPSFSHFFSLWTTAQD